MRNIREDVGTWIAIRRDEVGLGPRELAAKLEVDEKTVRNAEAGRTEIRRDRYRWEDELRWERGSLTRAYRDGTEPVPIVDEADEDAQAEEPDIAQLLAELIESAQRIYSKYLDELDGREAEPAGGRRAAG